VGGIVVWEQVNGGAPLYDEGRKLYTQEINAVVRGARRPTTITIELSTVDAGDQFRGRHGVKVDEPLKVVSRGKDWMEAWNQIWHY
jgi:hypothetical protein